MDQRFHDFSLGKDYPRPIVNIEESGKKARAKLWGHRKNEKVRAEKKRTNPGIAMAHWRRMSESIRLMTSSHDSKRRIAGLKVLEGLVLGSELGLSDGLTVESKLLHRM